MDTKANSSNEQPKQSESDPAPEYAPYPKLDPNDVVPVADTWTSAPSAPVAGDTPKFPSVAAATNMPSESNPYISVDAVPASSIKNNMDKVKDVLGRWGKSVAEATKKAEGLAGDMWQHLKTGPSVADAAVTRIAQGTKVLAEGGYEKVFQNTFDNLPEEKLLSSYGCYLSTSAGPVVGVLYLSTAKVAFCSDNPLSYKEAEEVRWSYYKVVIPLNQLKAVNPTTSKSKPAEKYIQMISLDNHEFWFMGFLNYDGAVKSILDAWGSQGHHL